MKTFRIALTFLVFIFIFKNSYCQVQHIVHYPLGQSGGYVFSAMADHQNKIWVTGQDPVEGDKIATYDGTNWIKYTLPPNMWNTLDVDFDTNNQMTFFLKISSGSYAAIKFNGATWDTTVYPGLIFPGNYQPDRLKIDDNGDYWFSLVWYPGNKSEAVARFDGVNLTVWDSAQFHLTGTIRDISLDHNNKVYILCNGANVNANGISIYDGGTWTQLADNPNNPANSYWAGDLNNNGEYFAEGQFSISSNNYIGIYKAQNDSIILYQNSFVSDAGGYPDIETDDDGTIYLGMQDNVYHLNGSIIDDLPQAQFPSPEIQLELDHAGSLWRTNEFMDESVDQYILLTGTPSLSTSGAALNIFPNPFTDELSIHANNNEESTVILYDIASRKLLQQEFSNSTTLNTQQLTPGIYLYEVYNKNGVVKNGKVVKQ